VAGGEPSMRVITSEQYPCIARIYFPERVLTLDFRDVPSGHHRQFHFWGCSDLIIRKKRLESVEINEEFRTLHLFFEDEVYEISFERFKKSNTNNSGVKTDRGMLSHQIEAGRVQKLLPELESVLPAPFEFLVYAREDISYNDCFAVLRSEKRSFLLNFGNCDGITSLPVGILRSIEVAILNAISYEITLEAEFYQKITCGNLAIYSLPHRFKRPGLLRKTVDAESYLLALRKAYRG
jgi:hypothetical protein